MHLDVTISPLNHGWPPCRAILENGAELLVQRGLTVQSLSTANLRGLFHPTCVARVVSWFSFVVAIFMAHENGDKLRPNKRRHVQGMLDETGPLRPNCKHFKQSQLNLSVVLASCESDLSVASLHQE